MYRILYVDDEPTLLEVGKIFLERSGQFSVDTISSAPAALALLESKNYDAIVADYLMPEMDGIEFLKKVRSSGNTIPFILFTGKGREDVVIEAINSGADYYLQKGGEPKSQFAELAHKIRQAIQKRQDEASIRDLERKQADIINFLPDATFAIDNNGVVIAWNRAMEEMTNVSAEEMLGKGDYEYSIPFYGYRRPILIDLINESDEVIAKNYAHIIHDKNFLIADTTLPHLNGKPITLMGKASPLYNRQGDVVGAIESIRDITDRKLFEDALRESERKYRSILENIQDVYYRTDPEGNLILASPSAAQLLGYDSVSEMIGINIAQSVYSNPEERSKFLAELNSRGFVTDYEVMIKKRDGTRIYVSTNSHKYFDLSGNFLGVEGIFRDITARKQAEEEILKKNEELAAASEELRTQFDALAESERSTRLSEKRLIMAQEIGHTGCWEYNLRTNEIWGSAEGLRIFGFPAIAGNFPINEIEACIPERERVHQALIDLISAGTDYNLEFTINPADGSASKMIHSIAKLENDAEGNPLRVVGVIQDITERKHADAAVRESTEIYRHFFRTSMDCVFITTKDGRWVDLNDAAVELFGYSNREELMKVRISDLYANPEDRKKHTDTIVEQGYTKEYPVDLRKKDGTVLHTLITSIARYDDDGAVTGFQGTIRDVSESRHTEQAVLESEERYRRITEAISDYIYTVRVENGRAVETRHGPGCVGVTGYTSEEFAADPYLWIRMVVEEDRPKVEDHVRHILLGEDVPAIEHRILRKDGTVHWVRNTPIRQLDADGRLVSYDGVIKDITVTKRAEDLTRTTLQQLSTLISRLNAGVIMVSEDGKVEQVNQALCDIYNLPDTPESLIGLTSQEMVNKILDAYVSPAEALARIRERTARGTHINGYEITLRNERTILVDYIPIIDADGKQRGRIWHHLDITGRKQAENALALASRKLNILSSITRHDILNQLTALSGFLQLYHEVCKGDAKVQEYFKRLMGIIKVIGDQISFTKFYQDLGVEAPVWLRVQDVARKAEVASGFSGVRFTIRTGDLEIFADPLLEKVFFNLFDNANRHGEQVTEIHVNSMFRDGECSIVVEDDGVGVPAADKERIFIRGVGKNTGLGLFLVREILSITGITIRETGVPGKGARFEIIVPAGACRSGKETSYRDQKQQGKRL